MKKSIENSTIHGINHIYSASQRFIKISWIILFLFGVIGIIVNIGFVVQKYLSNPITLSRSINHEDFIWPDITFCIPSSPYNFDNPNVKNHWKDVLNKTYRIMKIISNESSVFRIIYGKKNDQSEIALAMASVDQRKLEVENYTHYLLLFRYTKIINGFIYSLDNRPFNFKNLESVVNTQTVQFDRNIPCHTLNLEKLTSINQIKSISMTFILKFNLQNYLFFNSSYTRPSIYLYFTNINELPKNNGIKLYPGHFHTFTLNQNRYHYKAVKRKCRKNNFTVELYDALFQSTKLFEGNFLDCRKVESQKLIVKSCQCYSPFLPIYKNESDVPRICLNASFFSEKQILKNANCMVDIYDKYQKNETNRWEFDSKCSEFENNKCDELTYKIEKEKSINDLWTHSSNDKRNIMLKGMYTDFFAQRASNNKDYRKTLRDNLLALTIKNDKGFGDYYEEVYEYPFSELLSNIGGLMGLWLGMSVVGLFEIVEFIYLYLHYNCCKTIFVNRNDIK